ncbi:hypothetical protein [Mycolicibacterium sp. XJ647]
MKQISAPSQSVDTDAFANWLMFDHINQLLDKREKLTTIHQPSSSTASQGDAVPARPVHQAENSVLDTPARLIEPGRNL